MKLTSRKLTPNEFVIGAIYFALQLLIIPVILGVVNMVLPVPQSEAVVNFVFFAINFVAVILIFRKFLRENLYIAVEKPRSVLRSAGIGLAIYFAGTSIITTVNTLVCPEFANINDMAILNMVQEHFGLMVFGTVFLVPIAEEVFYRGLIFRQLFDRHPVVAYLISMAAFSIAHIAGYVLIADPLTLFLCFFQYLPAGFALAWCYHHSNSIFAPILAHMAVNFVGMLAMR